MIKAEDFKKLLKDPEEVYGDMLDSWLISVAEDKGVSGISYTVPLYQKDIPANVLTHMLEARGFKVTRHVAGVTFTIPE